MSRFLFQPSRRAQRVFALAVVLLVWALPLSGAEMRLERPRPSAYRLVLPESLGDSWADLHVARLQVRVAAGVGRLDEQELPTARALDFSVTAPGCSLVQVDVGPAVGPSPDAWQRATHCSKLVVCAESGDAETDRRARLQAGEILTAKTGSRIEIRPLFNPTVLTPGAVLPVRLYRSGRSIPGGRVTAAGEGGSRIEAVADGQGIAVLSLPRAGEWRLHFRHGGGEAELVFDVLPN